MTHSAPAASASTARRPVTFLIGFFAFCALSLLMTVGGVQAPLDSYLNTSGGHLPHLLRLPVVGLLLLTVLWNGKRANSDDAWSRLCRSRAGFGILVCAAVICCRWNRFAGWDFDPDESQSIVAARTLLVDSRFWISVDVGTHGPLVSLWQTLLPRVGLAIDYASSRLLGAFMLCVSLWAAFQVLRRVAPEARARVLLLPLVLIVATINTEGATAYNGEHPLTLLTLLALGFGVAALVPPRDAPQSAVSAAMHPGLLWASGVCLGAIPWAKVQGVPIAFALGLLLAYGCLTDPAGAQASDWPRRARLRRLLPLLGGALLPTLAVGVWVVSSGAAELMFRSYFQWNLAYATRFKSDGGAQAVQSALWMGQTFLKMSWVALWFTPAALAGLLAAPFARSGRRTGFLLLGVALVALAAWFAAIKPSNRYEHYAVLPLLPTYLLISLCWAAILDRLSKQNVSGPQRWASSGFVIAGILLPLTLGALVPNLGNRSGQLLAGWNRTPHKRENTTLLVGPLVRPGEPMVIWGWLPSLYVDTDTRAPRSSASLREALRAYPMQDYFYRLYLDDFDRLNPVVFVDEVQPYSDLVTQYRQLADRDPALKGQPMPYLAHEGYPELARRVRERYRLYQQDGWGARIYLRRDLWAGRAARLSSPAERVSP